MTFIITGLTDLQKRFTYAARTTGAAESRAVSRISTTIVANQARGIAQIVNLKIGDIKAAIQVVRKPTPDQPRVVFQVARKAISLISYAGRGSWKTASVQVLKAKGRTKVAGGFLTNAPNGAAQIWERTGKAKRRMTQGRYAGKMREPLEKLLGPSILSQYIKDAIQQIGQDTWNTRLPIELERETTFALKQAGLL